MLLVLYQILCVCRTLSLSMLISKSRLFNRKPLWPSQPPAVFRVHVVSNQRFYYIFSFTEPHSAVFSCLVSQWCLSYSYHMPHTYLACIILYCNVHFIFPLTTRMITFQQDSALPILFIRLINFNLYHAQLRMRYNLHFELNARGVHRWGLYWEGWQKLW